MYQSDALEDFDHAYRYAELLDTVGAGRLVDEFTTALPERSAAEEPEPGPETAGGPGSLSALRDAVLSHAAHEERYEFPELRERVPADRLRELG